MIEYESRRRLTPFFRVIGIVLPLLLSVMECSATQTERIYFAVAKPHHWQIFQIDADGGSLQPDLRIENDVLKLSLAGNGLDLLVVTSDRNIYLFDPIRGGKTKIKIGERGIVDAVLSNKGKSLLFSLSTGGSNDANHIWLADIASEKIKQLTNMKGMQHSPIWSHDDKFIFFLSGEGKQNEDIWRFDVESSSLNQLTAGQLYNFEPACSINNEIAFSPNRSGNYEIWVMDPFGGSVRQLTHNDGMDSQPSWSPDGESLVFVSNRSGQPALYIMDRDGKSTRKISPDGLICRNPVWGR